MFLNYNIVKLLFMLLFTAFATAQTYDTVNFQNPTGRQNIDYNNEMQKGMRVLKRTDGSLILGGRSGSNANIMNDFLLICVNQDGTRCSDFGINGVQDDSGFFISTVYDYAIQNDDKIIISSNFNSDLNVIRLNSDGSRDVTYGNNGIVTIPTPSDAIGFAGNGKIFTLNDDKVIAVLNYRFSVSPSRYKTAVYKINTTGVVDNSFGTSGMLSLDYGGFSSFCSDLFQSGTSLHLLSGGIPSVGTGRVTHLQKIDLNGVPDSTFGMNSILEISNVNLSAAIDIKGSTIALCGLGLTVGLFDSTGSPISSFGAEGVEVYNITNGQDFGRDIIIQPDGKLLVLFRGRMGTVGEDGLLMRLLADGTLDTSFNDPISSTEPGVFSMSIGLGNNSQDNMLLTDDGTLFVIGYANFFNPTGFDIIISKLLILDGTLSTTDVLSNKVRIYPNPVNDLLNYEGIEDISKINIFDLTGRKLLTSIPNQQQFINLTSLAIKNGLYIIQFETLKGFITKKFLKSNL
ncbi:secreted protein [Psychroflexus torquis ATCC 700755]|uniref:Secreted protein n=1 Tax=Psychroflexus torquis (strain ATCC 700755 / CIP 106069 / ACAM 623) TaxID=313595 RepID=K4ICJ2_PSYTT|nr:secreted protein [Psychroflexus torquis ATCC 700755]